VVHPHLDAPTPEVVKQRTDGFRPDDYFFDECVLCREAKESGGHVVFDCEVAASSGEETATELSADPAHADASALDDGT